MYQNFGVDTGAWLIVLPSKDNDETLYRRLLRQDWERVHAAVQRAHLSSESLEGRGIFKVTHGAGRIREFIAWLARIPRAADAAPVHLSVTRFGRTEKWLRQIGASRLPTLQSQLSDGTLAERFGLMEFCFRLAVIDGGIHYIQHRAALRIGFIRVPLPCWLSPQIRAVERPTGTEHEPTHVYVAIDLPLLGFLVSYEGDFHIEDSTP